MTDKQTALGIVLALFTLTLYGGENYTGSVLVSFDSYEPPTDLKPVAIEGQYVKDATTLAKLLKDIQFKGTKPDIRWDQSVAVVFVNSSCSRENIVQILSLIQDGKKLTLTWKDLASERNSEGVEVTHVWVGGRIKTVAPPDEDQLRNNPDLRRKYGHAAEALCSDWNQLLIARIPRKLFETYQLYIATSAGK